MEGGEKRSKSYCLNTNRRATDVVGGGEEQMLIPVASLDPLPIAVRLN